MFSKDYINFIEASGASFCGISTFSRLFFASISLSYLEQLLGASQFLSPSFRLIMKELCVLLLTQQPNFKKTLTMFV